MHEFSNPAFLSWPAVSIAWRLVTTGLVSANIATIIRYAKIMGLDAARKVRPRSRKRGSLSAEKPNQAWHMDVTVVATADNRKAYLQLILDNYSRKIIAWKVSTSVSGLNSVELLKSAFSSLTDRPAQDISLIVDGGPENNNRLVQAWIADAPVRKLVAQVDVSFSNSMIEAVNKIIKYRYLFRKPIPDLDRIPETVSAAIADYNARPHYAHHGLSPDETHNGKVFDREAYRRQLRAAREKRLRENRAVRHPCQPWDSQPASEVPAEGAK